MVGGGDFARGDHTPLRFVTMCDNGVFNGGYLCTSQYIFLSYLKIQSYFDIIFSTLYLFVII